MSAKAEDEKHSGSSSSLSSSDVDSPKDADDGQERAAWGGQLEFILTCVGYAVGLGNVWRFPYLCYSNGGGAFLIPYICMLAFVGLPLFYMELCIGQFASLGPLAVWKFNPMFKGLGYASVMVSWLIALYYNVIIAICFYFFFMSMRAEVPWAHCENLWNDDRCVSLDTYKLLKANSTNETVIMYNNYTLNETETPSEQFFYKEVLRLTDGMDVAGGMRWELAGCLLLAWTIVCIVLIRGISSLGKVVYFTALFPYVLLTVLLVRGALLEGSLTGIIFYLNPQWEKLGEAKVWSDAAVQIFYSLGVASGGLMAMASYNKFNNNTQRDSLIVPIINCCTSIYAGFVIFSILGYMAELKDVDVKDVAAQGPGLTFVVYPEALSTMPLPPLWSILFFFMMIILGFSSEFSMMECVLTAFLDEFPVLLKSSRKREITFRIGACVVSFLLGVAMCTEGGFYLLNLVDNYVGGFPLIIVGIGELAAINWVYGFKRFSYDISLMLGKGANPYFIFMWVGFSPLLMLGVLGFTAYQYKPLVFQGYVYTPGFSAIGWLIVAFCVMFIPVIAIYTLIKNRNDISKSWNPDDSWGPAHAKDRVGTIYGPDIPLKYVSTVDGGELNNAYTKSNDELPTYSSVVESEKL